jgi:hypothetical protein
VSIGTPWYALYQKYACMSMGEHRNTRDYIIAKISTYEHEQTKAWVSIGPIVHATHGNISNQE